MDDPADIADLVPVDPSIAIAAQADAEQVAGHYQAAIALYRLAAALNPRDLSVRSRLARALFCAEDWDAAWQAYEIRFRLTPNAPDVSRRMPDGTVQSYPRWRGGPTPRRILVLHEQGLGDTIQFCRFLPELLNRGPDVVLMVPGALVPLMRRTGLPIDVRALEDKPSMAGIESWIPLLDLPRALRLRPEVYTAAKPYLSADPGKVAAWRERVGTHGLKVGIAWAGNPEAAGDRARSLRPDALAPLVAVPGIRLFSLQKQGEDALARSPLAGMVEDLGPDFDSGPEAFADTAALLQSLDALVSVDTAIAHLAGAMGRPVHLLLARPWADWRWLGRETDTIWYPTMTLYRQDRAGDWSAPVARVAAALSGRGAERAGDTPRRKPLAPVSVGDLLDRVTILEIKAARMRAGPRLAHVLTELGELRAVVSAERIGGVETPLTRLREANASLWELESEIRQRAAARRFDSGYVDLARGIHEANDRRAALKREINELAGSALVEEKWYGETG
jgi:hypothetical protein